MENRIKLLDSSGVLIRMLTKKEARELWITGSASCHEEDGEQYMKTYRKLRQDFTKSGKKEE